MPLHLLLISSQAADLSPVLSVPDGIALQEIRVTMGTAQKCFHLDVGVVYGINDLLTVRTYTPLAQHTNIVFCASVSYCCVWMMTGE